MRDSPFVRSDRGSDAPLSVDLAGQTGSHALLRGWAKRPDWARRIPRSLLGTGGYVLAGVVLGLILIIALTLSRGDGSDSSRAAAGRVVTDNVIHLYAKDIGRSCWRGADRSEPARVTVSLEIGLDGKVRNAVAAGESAAMRGCVESLVKGWEFLPQASSSQMVLPVEISTR